MSTQDELLLKLIYQEENAQVLSDARAALDKMTDAEKDLIKQQADATKANKQQGISLTDLKSGFELVGMAAQGVGKVYNALVGDTMEYVGQVKDLALNLGLTTEETSKLMSVGQKFGVSNEQITSSLQMMVKRGMAPSLDGLGKLADQMMAIKDPVERAKQATEIFGRNWTALMPILEKGSAGINAAADEAARFGKIVSQEAADSAEEFEIQINTLNERVDGLKTRIGTGIIPTIVKWAKEANFAAGVLQGTNTEAENQANALEVLTRAYGENSNEVRHFKEILDQANASQMIAISVSDKMTATLEKTTGQTDEEREALVKAQLAVNDYSDAGDRAIERSNAMATSLKAATIEFSSLKTVMVGAVQNEMESFNQKQNDLGGKAQELEKTIRTSYGKVHDDAVEELKGVNSELEANAKKHEDTTKRILFTYAEQAIATQNLRDGVTGFTKDQMAALDELAVKWGLKSQEDIAAMRAIDQAVNTSATTKDWEVLASNVIGNLGKVRAELDKYKTGLLSIPQSIQTMISMEIRGAEELKNNAPTPQGPKVNPGIPSSGGPVKTCFIAGTLITLADGATKPIEEIAAGDLVLSFLEDVLTANVVLSTQISTAITLYTVTFNGGSFTATGEHPIYAPHVFSAVPRIHGDFIEVKYLQVGDQIEGPMFPLVITNITSVTGDPVNVYNFNVDETHTYIANGVMVHNVKSAAAGANFIVPPGYPNDSYPMRVTSGERVIVEPRQAVVNNNWNVNADQAGMALLLERQRMMNQAQFEARM